MQQIALVVDDSRVARMTLSKLLHSHFFEVIEIGSGEEAISHLQMMATKPDIIFMDVMMGGMDGLTTTRQIKSDTTLNSIPVVICTGNDSETDKDNALATGAIAVLSKPPSLDDLAIILSKLGSDTSVEIQSVEPAILPVDNAALVAKIMVQIEQDIQKITGELVTNQVTSQVNKLIPNITDQIIAQSKHATEILAEQVATQISRAIAEKTAQQSVQNTIAAIDISAQVSHTLSSEGMTWLRHQEHKIYTQLSEKLEQTIASAIQQHLEAELALLIEPLVSDQLNKHLAQQRSDDEQVAKQLNQTVSKLKEMIVGVSVIVLILAGAMLSSLFNLV
ncbi:MAG: response regulator [Piscirickettsiaceae bacterium]|nr:response regulator [Piscirickettsiaceae bacterium]